jgi:hypothetical protein
MHARSHACRVLHACVRARTLIHRCSVCTWHRCSACTSSPFSPSHTSFSLCHWAYLTLYRSVSLSLSFPHSLDNIEHTRSVWWSGLFWMLCRACSCVLLVVSRCTRSCRRAVVPYSRHLLRISRGAISTRAKRENVLLEMIVEWSLCSHKFVSSWILLPPHHSNMSPWHCAAYISIRQHTSHYKLYKLV